MDLRRLATHVWYLMGALLLLHLACSIAALVTINKQKAFILGVSDAGEKQEGGWRLEAGGGNVGIFLQPTNRLEAGDLRPEEEGRNVRDLPQASSIKSHFGWRRKC